MTSIKINKHFKVDAKSLEKSRFIREIFEIDDLLTNSYNFKSTNNKLDYTANCVPTSLTKSMSSLNGFNTSIYFKPTSSTSNSNFNLDSNKDKISNYINNIIDLKVSNLSKDSNIKDKRIINNLNRNIKEKDIKKEKKSSFFSYLKQLVFGESNKNDPNEQIDRLGTNYETDNTNTEENIRVKNNIPFLKTNKLNNLKSDKERKKEFQSPIKKIDGELFKKETSSSFNKEVKNIQTEGKEPKLNSTSSSFHMHDGNNHKQKNSIYNDNLLFVPCLNCNDMVHLDDIENHSNYCIVIKEECDKAEKSKYAYHAVDFKLKKIHEHILSLQSEEDLNKSISMEKSKVQKLNIKDSNKKKNELSKEVHIFHLLEITIKDTINIAKISSSSITTLKKFLINLDVSNEYLFNNLLRV
jgi:hypothetical protein